MCRIKRIERHFTLIVVTVLFVLTFLEKRSQREIIKTNVKMYNRTKQLYRVGNSSVSSVDNSTRNTTSNKVNVTDTHHRRVLNVTDKPLREERNNVFKYEIKFVPKDFACQGQEIIKGLVTQSRNLFMCSLKLEEFSKYFYICPKYSDTC